MCSGPYRGASGTQQLARLHRKGPHRLEAWRSGAKVATTLETTPETKPGTKKLGTKLATSARPQNTAACRPHAPLSKLHIRDGLRPLPPTPSWEAPMIFQLGGKQPCSHA